jgi:hypothetical protein
MAMIVCSLVMDSANLVIAVWRRSWNRSPGSPAVFVALRHAVLMLAIGLLASILWFSQAGKIKCSGLASGVRLAHFTSIATAD